MTRYDVYEKIRFLLDQKLPYQMRISALAIYDPVQGPLPVTEGELKA